MTTEKTLVELGERGLLTQNLGVKPIDRAEPEKEVYVPQSPLKTVKGLFYVGVFGVCGLLTWALLTI